MPDPQLWTAVDEYVTNLLVTPDDALEGALAASAAAGLPPISVSPPQGKLLAVLVEIRDAHHILEIGTLGGYSTIWMARALPAKGRLISLEVNPHHAEVARRNLAAAGVDSVAEVRVGAALDTLPKMVDDGEGPFDFVFIDADKANIPDYFESGEKPEVVGVRRLHEVLATDRRVTATTIQTVGSKGYDGFTLAIVKVDPAVL
jgi:predicted O-methyltransferase YrrM